MEHNDLAIGQLVPGSRARRIAPRLARVAGLARERRGLLAIILAGLWLAATIDVVRRWQELAVGDFQTYWTGAHSLVEGNPLYPRSQLEGPFVLGDAAFGRGFVYPPTAALLSAPLAMLPMAAAFAIFTAISAIALAGVVFAIARREGATRRVAAAIALVIAGTGPGLDALLTGNVNALAAAAVGGMWLAPRVSGYLAVLGGLVKVYPGIGVIWSVRRRAPLVRPVILGSLIVLGSIAIVGTGPWADFRQTMANGLSNEYFPIQSPRSLLWAPLGVVWAGVAAMVLTAVALVAVLRIRNDRLAFFVLSVGLILPAPEWHLHYLLIPAVGALPFLLPRGRSSRPSPDRAGGASNGASGGGYTYA